MLILLFMLILNVYMYLVSRRNKELFVSAVCVHVEH